MESGTADECKKIRYCPEFDRVTRKIFGFGDRVDLSELEYDMVKLPKARKGSMALGERLFMDAIAGTSVTDLLEIGSNIGRHSRRFLAETSLRIHSFEPNTRLFHNYQDLIGMERMIFNPYGLSDQPGLAVFQLIDEMTGHTPDSTHGMSSFENVASRYEEMHGSVKLTKITAAKARGDAYIEAAGLTDARLALWIDVEGHSPSVLEGFGSRLSQADVVICEVEPVPDYTGTPTADIAIRTLEAAGLTVVFRDFQYHGRFNIVALSPAVIARAATPVMDELQTYRRNVVRHAKRRL